MMEKNVFSFRAVLISSVFENAIEQFGLDCTEPQFAITPCPFDREGGMCRLAECQSFRPARESAYVDEPARFVCVRVS